MTAREKSRKHPVNGKELLRGEREITLTFRGQTKQVMMPGWYAADDLTGDDGLHEPADMKVSDRVMNSLKAEAAGLLNPAEVKSIRKRLRITQREAGTIIGGGPNAFQKYETGDILVSKAIDTALRLLARDPTRLQELRTEDQAVRAG
ncbi:type II toxin-antitoxin system MqsA family antitoxin [Paracoccus sp. IB05]|uniref:type II toxin-antitoxin system MqsA family antitoxin n=1 Tax=Paracoccus sp. IB05 TaxID=2779367 RepID=UPI0018E72152|nr:type II toxin-antitoxin system MqsA family antitoxin [Paracoccus sp. IB05]MBJ2152681.1 type II toxin-antitoxin system MqsA family antitoxin [Paracoccus sp. IB05]